MAVMMTDGSHWNFYEKYEVDNHKPGTDCKTVLDSDDDRWKPLKV